VCERAAVVVFAPDEPKDIASALVDAFSPEEVDGSDTV
jgi:hypothetical protein